MITENKIKLLIVEDDLLIAHNLKTILEDLGFDVAEPCCEFEEAINIMENEHFDIALLDIDLNGKDDGIRLGKIINSKYYFPFIFLTAFSDKQTIAMAAEAKSSGYLVKPTSSATLFASIQTAIYNFQNNTTAKDTDSNLTDSFFVKTGNKLSRIQWNEVVSISAGKNYVTIQINKINTPEFPIRSTLQQAINNLIPTNIKDQFIQISRTHCINLSFVQQIQNDNIITAFGIFEIGDKYKKDLKNRLNIVQ